VSCRARRILAWTEAEQAELADFLRDLAQRTRAKVLLTSRRDERPWLAGLPARVRLPTMPRLHAEHDRLAAVWAPRRKFVGLNRCASTADVESGRLVWDIL
jgi:hypothetical protein